MKENAVYLQSGGPTSVINASLFGVINQVEISDTIGDLFLSHYGIKGLINNDLKNAKSIPTEQIELLPYMMAKMFRSLVALSKRLIK